MWSKAVCGHPPLQPSLLPSQSTNCCSETDTRFPVAMACPDSTTPMVEKAQQDPHWPWSLIGFTKPFWTQSTASATSSEYSTSKVGWSDGGGGDAPVYWARNSSTSKSANTFTSIIRSRLASLCSSIFTTLAL